MPTRNEFLDEGAQKPPSVAAEGDGFLDGAPPGEETVPVPQRGAINPPSPAQRGQFEVQACDVGFAAGETIIATSTFPWTAVSVDAFDTRFDNQPPGCTMRVYAVTRAGRALLSEVPWPLSSSPQRVVEFKGVAERFEIAAYNPNSPPIPANARVQAEVIFYGSEPAGVYLKPGVAPVQGSILYFDGKNWTTLAPGTAGQVLTTEGANQNPQWSAVSGGQVFVWSPGGTAGGNVYTSRAALDAAIAAMDPGIPATVVLDESHQAPGSTIVFAAPSVAWRPAGKRNVSLVGIPNATCTWQIQGPNGAIWQYANLILDLSASAAAIMTLAASEVTTVSLFNVFFPGAGSATLPLVDATAASAEAFIFLTAATDLGPRQTLAKVSAASSNAYCAIDGSSTLDTDTLQGPAAQIRVTIGEPAGSYSTTQPRVTGGAPGVFTSRPGFGTYATRPAAGNPGRRFTASDGLLEFVDDGTQWRPMIDGVPGWEVAPGNSIAAFTQVGTAPSSTNVQGGCLYYQRVSGGGTHTPVIYEQPKSANQSLTVCLKRTVSGSSCAGGGGTANAAVGSIQDTGITVRDTASGKYYQFTLGETGNRDNFLYFQIDTFSAFGIYNNTLLNGILEGVSANAPIWLRITETGGTTLDFYYSTDGVNYYHLAQAVSGYVPGDGNRYGVVVDPYNGDTGITVLSFKIQ